MQRIARLCILIAGLLLPAAGLHAAPPLVDAVWLRDRLGDPGLVVLDVRNPLGEASAQDYRKGHIPGAVYSDYLRDGWRSTVDGTPGQLPPVAQLEALIGGLGIDNDSHVVIVAGGRSALDMGSATRVYWTFKVLGHDAVSILDGGYRAYSADPGNPIETGWNEPEPTIFEANLRPELRADHRQVAAAMRSGAALIDTRPTAQFDGAAKHGAAARAGTIPGAVNIPEDLLTRPDGRFVEAPRMAALLAAVGLGTQGEQIVFCNTGHWASLGWFLKSEILGNKDAKLYDGSMVDWSARTALPMAPGVSN